MTARDQKVIATATVTLLVADDRADAAQDARDLLMEELRPLVRSEYDWGGKFIIATRVEVHAGNKTAVHEVAE